MTRSFLLFLLLLLPIPSRALNIVINNQNSAYPAAQVYFTFRDAAVSGTINGQAIVRDQNYTLNDIGTGITLTSFSGGRIYFSLGSPIAGTGDPEPINSSVATWGTRFDKMELTYSSTNHYGVANLTAIDYFAIPLAIKTYAGTTATGTPKAVLTYQPPGNVVSAALAGLTNNNAKVLLHDKLGNFLRVLGPTLAPSGAYPSFQPYLAAVRTAGQSTVIQGLYSQAGTTTPHKTQTYQFTATFDTTGNLVMNGGGISYAGGPSVGLGHQIVVAASDLALGVYSANPGYTVDGAAAHIGDNDVYSAVVRDILTGYALGFVNSATIDPKTGTAFKDEISDKWWLSAQAFDFLQPANPTFYDQYAAYLQTISNAYGHPFSDRWQTVQASLDPSSVGTMEIDVLADAGGFEAWRVANFSATELQNTAFSGAVGDTTGAGVSNLIKYALGVAPRQAGVGGLPTFGQVSVGGVSYPALSYTYNVSATDAGLSMQASGDLQTWSSGAGSTTEVSRSTNMTGTRTTVVTRANTPIGSGARQFLRLGATLTGGN